MTFSIFLLVINQGNNRVYQPRQQQRCPLTSKEQTKETSKSNPKDLRAKQLRTTKNYQPWKSPREKEVVMEFKGPNDTHGIWWAHKHKPVQNNNHIWFLHQHFNWNDYQDNRKSTNITPNAKQIHPFTANKFTRVALYWIFLMPVGHQCKTNTNGYKLPAGKEGMLLWDLLAQWYKWHFVEHTKIHLTVTKQWQHFQFPCRNISNETTTKILKSKYTTQIKQPSGPLPTECPDQTFVAMAVHTTREQNTCTTSKISIQNAYERTTSTQQQITDV